jgi:CRP/FNR family cyclic AMP-dependent transcriptional regulator
MPITPSDLRAIPLFQDISDAHLEALMDVFVRETIPAGKELFHAGDPPQQLLLLVSGEVVLREGDEVRFRLRPIAPIGELGAITGLRRYTTAVTAETSEIWSIPTAKLMDFFREHGEVAFPFYHNLLSVVSDKVRRDERRIREMRSNIVRTQKAMKRIRDLILEAEDTPLSKPIFEAIEDLIEHNRRWHYQVEPARTLLASVRLDDGTLVPVHEMSDAWMKIGKLPGNPPKEGEHWTGVLVLPSSEIPISGTVEAVEPGAVAVKLDMLIQEYAAELEDYLTRLHMLDFVV